MTTLSEWLLTAQPGERFPYYVGELSRDRAMRREGLDEASLALTLAESFRLHLIQKRTDVHCFEYVAVKASPEYTARMNKRWHGR